MSAAAAADIVFFEAPTTTLESTKALLVPVIV
jgi:hypothetical protein